MDIRQNTQPTYSSSKLLDLQLDDANYSTSDLKTKWSGPQHMTAHATSTIMTTTITITETTFKIVS